MLWTARHRWLSGTRFAIELLLTHWVTDPVVAGGHCEILLLCEGVMRGDPLAMILYGEVAPLLPLSESL